MNSRYEITYTIPSYYGELVPRTTYCNVYDMGNGMTRFVSSDLSRPLDVKISYNYQIFEQLAKIAGMISNDNMQSLQISSGVPIR